MSDTSNMLQQMEQRRAERADNERLMADHRRDFGMTVKCLSVCQPWADAIVYGGKNIENRTWFTEYRGPLLIHASKSKAFYNQESLNFIKARWPGSNDHWCRNQMRFGQIIGLCKLADCVSHEEAGARGMARWAEGPKCFVLISAEPMDIPQVFKGERGLFDVPFGALSFPIYRQWRHKFDQDGGG